MSVGLGKFNSVEAIIAYRFLLDSCGNDSIQFGEETGDWAERFDGPVSVDNLVNVLGADWRAEIVEECAHGTRADASGHHGYEQNSSDAEHAAMVDDAVASLVDCAGIILVGDDRGFVSAESYSSPADLEREWARLRKVEDDIYREQAKSEHDDHVSNPRHSLHNTAECEWCAPIEGWTIGDVFANARCRGLAYEVVGFDDGNIVGVMVGDDQREVIDVRDCERLIAREDYCGECGQTGCTQDGYSREEETTLDGNDDANGEGDAR